jgi:hypothetical protein
MDTASGDLLLGLPLAVWLDLRKLTDEAREVVPYAVEGMLDGLGVKTEIFSGHFVGVDLYLDPIRVPADTFQRLRHVLQRAIAALDKHQDDAPQSRRADVLERAGYHG